MNNKIIEELLQEIDRAYAKSNLKKQHKEWSYALFGSKPIDNPILLLGLNFGAAGDTYTAQTLDGIKQAKPFSDMNIDDLGKSFLRLKNYISNYEKIDIGKIVWSNFCFFRSQSENELSKEDIDLTKPIFKKLLHHTKPIEIICVSKSLYNFLNNEKLIKNKQEKNIKINAENTYTVIKATLYDYPFYCLPHPNYPATKEGRKKCWDFCFS